MVLLLAGLVRIRCARVPARIDKGTLLSSDDVNKGLE